MYLSLEIAFDNFISHNDLRFSIQAMIDNSNLILNSFNSSHYLEMGYEILDKERYEIQEAAVLAYSIVYRLVKVIDQKFSEIKVEEHSLIENVNHFLLSRHILREYSKSKDEKSK